MLRLTSKAFILMLALSTCNTFQFAKTNKMTELVKVNARKRFLTSLIDFKKRFPLKINKEQPRKNICIKPPTPEEIDIAKKLKRLRKTASERQIEALQECAKISDVKGILKY